MTTEAPPAEVAIPEWVPSILSPGDVAVLLGASLDQVQSLRRARKLRGDQPWGPGTNWEYSPLAVAECAAKVGREIDWGKLTD